MNRKERHREAMMTLRFGFAATCLFCLPGGEWMNLRAWKKHLRRRRAKRTGRFYMIGGI